jgi:hypothetical protein
MNHGWLGFDIESLGFRQWGLSFVSLGDAVALSLF